MQHDPTQADKSSSRARWWIASVPLAVFVALMIEPHIDRERHLATLEQNSAPLVQAIRAYARDEGVPPPSLQALVPRYIDQLPETGYRPNRRFTLSRGPGPEWNLEVRTTDRMSDVDTFQYYSRDPRWRLVPANEVR